MSDVVLMKIKDKNGAYSGSYNEHGIKGAILCENEYLPQFSKGPNDEVRGGDFHQFSFSIHYENKFYETLQNWSSSCDEVKAVRIAEVDFKSDSQNPTKKIPVLVRELELFNVFVNVNMFPGSRTAELIFTIPHDSKNNDELPGLIQTSYLAKDKASQVSNVLYVNLLTHQALNEAHSTWKSKEIEEIIK